MSAVKAIERSSNAKIGEASATYVSQTSCPASCAFRNHGCYAESSYVGIITRRLNEEAHDAAPDELAEEEAHAIDQLTGLLPLRVHVVGDAVTNEAARFVGSAMQRHTAKHGRAAWTYTHAWREVDRDAWGAVAVQASCETAGDVDLAARRGYASAVVVDRFRSTKRYQHDGLDVIPCPEQTRGVKCVDCGLCLNPASIERRRLQGVSIGFAAHGASTKVREALRARHHV